MYSGPYFVPGYYSFMQPANMMRGAMMIPNMSRGMGLMGRIGNSFSWLRGINWSGLINGASRTLGVVNQTIPLVRQVGPMFNNVRSMFRVVSAFRDETDNSSSKNNIVKNVSNNNLSKKSEENNIKNNYNNYGPTFFTE